MASRKNKKLDRQKRAVNRNKRLLDSYLADADNKLKFDYRIQISKSKTFGNSVALSLEENLNCEFGEFKTHLEQKFTDGMAWDNYRVKWEFDFIIPLIKGGSLDHINIEPKLK